MLKTMNYYEIITALKKLKNNMYQVLMVNSQIIKGYKE